MLLFNRIAVLLLVVIAFSSCSKDDLNQGGNDGQFFSYNGIICGANPAFCYVDTTLVTITDASTFFTEITTVSGQEQILINIGGIEITVDFEGIADYSSDSTNLSVSSCSFDGIFNRCFVSAGSPYTGAYIEILKHHDGYIEGNFRFLLRSYDPLNNNYDYTGMDNGLFKIKLR